MKYPRLPEELDARIKLRKDQREEILKLYAEGATQAHLARLYSVSRYTIREVIDPTYKKARSDKANAYNKKQRALKNQGWLDRKREQSAKSHRKKRKLVGEERVYDREQLRRWKVENPEKWAKIVANLKLKKQLTKSKCITPHAG